MREGSIAWYWRLGGFAAFASVALFECEWTLYNIEQLEAAEKHGVAATLFLSLVGEGCISLRKIKNH